jgi:hypothetical protein
MFVLIVFHSKYLISSSEKNVKLATAKKSQLMKNYKKMRRNIKISHTLARGEQKTPLE